jgi:hypothetical protein
MSKIFASGATLGVLLMLALPGAANAAERRADGLRSHGPAAQTEFSSADRYYANRYVVRRPFDPASWGPGFGYYWQPLYGFYPYYAAYYYPNRPAYYGPSRVGVVPAWGW